MIKKLILVLYKRLIKRLVNDYDNNKDTYAGERYLKHLKKKINIKKSLGQQLFNPDYIEFSFHLRDTIMSILQTVIDVFLIILLPFYNMLKLLVFPFRIYIVKAVRAEILKQIEKTND